MSASSDPMMMPVPDPTPRKDPETSSFQQDDEDLEKDIEEIDLQAEVYQLIIII